MHGNSRPVSSNQNTIHEQLDIVVEKHLTTNWQAPLHEHSKSAFEQLSSCLNNIHNHKYILDSACGTGDSSYRLAEIHKQHIVIGIDKSAKRLSKYNAGQFCTMDGKVILLRADVLDLWRLIYDAKWPIEKHYLFYPNPWPKKKHLQRRWHGHPVFPTLIQLCKNIELRSNWSLYVEEFERALAIAGINNTVIDRVEKNEGLSPFEEKYFNSGHDLYRLTCSSSFSNQDFRGRV